MTLNRSCFLFLLTLLFFSCGSNENSIIKSPDGNLRVDVSLNEQGQLYYEILKNDLQVLSPSLLGIIREDTDFSKDLKLIEISESESFSDEYILKVHKKAQYSYFANQKIIRLTGSSGEEMQVIFQVSDNGVAFRYFFPSANDEIKKISQEKTSWSFPEGTRAWLQPCAHAKTSWGNTNPSYEEHYLQDIPVGTASPLSGWVFPALFKTGEDWVLLSETAPGRNYCASRLISNPSDSTYSIGFPEEKEVVFSGELNPESKLPWYTPWRIVAIGSLADIVESSLGTDLAEPAIKGDFSWVQPGRASWSWVLLKDDFTIVPVQKEFIDYASEMGWEYCLVDGFWDTQIGYEGLQELVDYGKEKNVKILLWYNSAGDWNTTPITPKNALLTREDRIKEFTRIKEMGVAGVKVDFFGGDGQSVMNHYSDVLEDAAEVGLAVNFHGCTLPRGMQRTYPNLLSMESIMGMEFITFTQDNADVAANHCTMIPFTRNVFDPMDFTPTCFGEITNIERRTSNGFELALSVLFQSGVQHYAEIPKVMQQMPDYVQELMRDIPAVWDETRLIDGYPGKFVIMARRSDKTWYIAGINGQDEKRTFEIDLSFAGDSKGFIVSDGKDNRSFKNTDLDLAENPLLNIKLNTAGGFLIHLEAK